MDLALESHLLDDHLQILYLLFLVLDHDQKDLHSFKVHLLLFLFWLKDLWFLKHIIRRLNGAWVEIDLQELS